MPGPTVKHTGFLIPNAKDVTATVLAEPDKIDFATLGNSRWGVIEGCAVNPQGGNLISVAAGTAVVNGKLVHVNQVTNIPVTVPNAQARFDLIVVNDAGTVMVHPGDTLDDAVFPDPELTETVLAAVYCTSTSSDYTGNVIDKRKFLPASLFAKMSPTDELIRNVNNAGNHYKVLGDGTTWWEDDTKLRRSTAQTLEVTNNVYALGDITAGDDINALGDVAAVGTVAASNLRRDIVLPTGTFQFGDLLQNTATGRIYVWAKTTTGGQWQELVTSSASVPVGTIITSVQDPATLKPYGWAPLDGSDVSETDFPSLFTLAVMAKYIVARNTSRMMHMPNLNKKMLMIDSTAVGTTGGVTNGVMTLQTKHLPVHNHSVGGVSKVTGDAGAITPAANVAASGAHSHTVSGGRHQHHVVDPGHHHQAAELAGHGAQVIAVHDEHHLGPDDPGGQNKIDAMFNDRSHTFSVEAMTWTMRNPSYVSVSGDLSDHDHVVAGGDHTHSVSFASVAAHHHSISEANVGGGEGFDIMPAYFAVYAYIKG